MSIFMNENLIKDIVIEIFDTIEEYKKNFKKTDYSNLSTISDNMVYRSKR